MASAIEMARTAPDGPSTMAAMVTPMAWPVVPPGSGRLNIITTNPNAANTETSGTTRPPAAGKRLRRSRAAYHPAMAAAYSVAQVDGLKYPSGICMQTRQARSHNPNLFGAHWLDVKN